jgi:hypothetical protein
LYGNRALPNHSKSVETSADDEVWTKRPRP